MLLQNVPEGRCDRSLARSAWNSATPKEPSRRVWCRELSVARESLLTRRMPRACCEMSQRDDAIVAWHEVPGTTPPQKSRPVGYGLIRAAMRAKFDDWSDEISFRIRRTFRREIPLELAAPDHTGTLLDGSFEGRFPRRSVPGYDRCCLSRTRLQTFRNRL
jgi:hypothetical protein